MGENQSLEGTSSLQKGRNPMKKATMFVLGTLMILMSSNNAAAGLVFGDGGTSLQGVLDGITVDPIGNSSVDVTTDALSDAADSCWSVSATGGSISTLIIEMAGFANQNKFGIYDKADDSKRVQLFNGVAGSGDMVLVSIRANGSVYVNFMDTGIDFASNEFGYYLDSTHASDGGFWHSDTSLNTDMLDHMAAYQGKGTDQVQIDGLAAGLWTQNEYILAFEDLKANVSDTDYNDFVVMVESVTPTVPEPATMALLGLGSLVLWKRKVKVA
jgi:hypothetical protein